MSYMMTHAYIYLYNINETCVRIPNKVFSQLGLPSEAGLGHFWDQLWALLESYPSENLSIHGFSLAWLAGRATGPTRLAI